MRIRLGHCRDEGDNTELHSRRKANNTEYNAPHRKEVIQTQLCVIGGGDVQLRFVLTIQRRHAQLHPIAHIVLVCSTAINA